MADSGSTFEERMKQTAQLERRGEVAREEQFHLLRRVIERLFADVAARVVDQHVQHAAAGQVDGIQRRLPVIRDGHIRAHAVCLVTLSAPLSDRLQNQLPVAGHDEHLRPEGKKFLRHGETDPLRAPSDQCFFPDQRPTRITIHHLLAYTRPPQTSR